MISELLTVVITTSALPRHPCSALLDEIIGSIHRHCEGSLHCRMLIVADGYNLSQENKPSRWKRGIVSQLEVDRYEAHKRAIRFLCSSSKGPYAHADLLEQPCRRGFTLGVCRALRCVHTPFVLVVQHDRPMMRDVPLCDILAAMRKHPQLEHVSLPTAMTLSYENLVLSKYGIVLSNFDVHHRSMRFVPLLQFLDTTHVASTSAYLALMRRHRFSCGAFTEDTLGQEQLAAIRNEGMKAHTKYATWIVDDGVAKVMVSHLDGRDARALQKFRPSSIRPSPATAPEALMSTDSHGSIDTLANTECHLERPLRPTGQSATRRVCYACNILFRQSELLGPRVLMAVRVEKLRGRERAASPALVRLSLRVWRLSHENRRRFFICVQDTNDVVDLVEGKKN